MTAHPERVARRRRRCPICGAPAVAAVRPFCSKRCADVDLGRWLGGEYRISVPGDDTGDDYGDGGGDDDAAGGLDGASDEDAGSAFTDRNRARRL